MKSKPLFIFPRDNESYLENLIAHGIKLEDIVICNANQSGEPKHTLRSIRVQGIFILKEQPFNIKNNEMYSWILGDVKKYAPKGCKIISYIEVPERGLAFHTISEIKEMIYSVKERT